MFSLSMIFGGIWAYLAWGTYWLWTPKELWTTILWIFYSLYLHARLKKEWMGKPSVILGIIGFGITLFTYLGVSLLMKRLAYVLNMKNKTGHSIFAHSRAIALRGFCLFIFWIFGFRNISKINRSNTMSCFLIFIRRTS